MEGGVGDEGREEELQLGLVCCVGLVSLRNITCAAIGKFICVIIN